jgi:hypothetical protein
MDAPTLHTTARRYLAAYAARELATLSPLLADGVTLRDWNLCVAGKPAALAETQKNFDAVQGFDIDVLALYGCPNGVAAELRIDIVNLDGSQSTIYVVDVFDFDAEGRISAVRAYLGRGDAR